MKNADGREYRLLQVRPSTDEGCTMSATQHPPPPPPPAAAKPDRYEWLEELAEKTRAYSTARRYEQEKLANAASYKREAETWNEAAIKALKEIAALMRTHCGPSLMAGLAAEGAEELERRTMAELDGVDPDADTWTLAEEPPGGIDLADPPHREEVGDD